MTTVLIITVEDLVYDLKTMGVTEIPEQIIKRWSRDGINIEDNTPVKETKEEKTKGGIFP